MKGSFPESDSVSKKGTRHYKLIYLILRMVSDRHSLVLGPFRYEGDSLSDFEAAIKPEKRPTNRLYMNSKSLPLLSYDT